METAGLKKFAQSARSSLKKQVASKLAQVLAQDSAARRERPAAVSALESSISAEKKDAVIDRVAYTWFNRFCALRFMDANGYTRIGIVSPAEGHSQPEILAEAKMGHIDEAMVPERIANHVYALLDGSAPSRDPQAEAYRLLVVAACNSYHAAMPYLFERIEDYTELLMPDDLLSASSILTQAREAMTDEACEKVEVIGWLYQFYISEKKDQVIGKVVKSEDIPAATQLFTPNWIVKYMVQNSLGAHWLATYPDSPLKGQMEYYIEPAEQTGEVNAQLAAITPDTLDPEELTLIDPACGSGHILTEAYDLFKAIYLERGYQQRNAVKLILEKNLFGLEICPRAAQLTGFALMMKARADDRRIFDRGVQLNIMALQDSKGFDPERLAHGIDLADNDLEPRDLTELKDLFEHATTFGSLTQVPEELAEKLPALKQLCGWQAPKNVTADAETQSQIESLSLLVQQAEVLATQYDAVVANPPYMGSGGMNPKLKKFAKGNFPDAKSDLFACFIERGYTFAKNLGYNAMVTMQSWMFLSSLEKMRERLLRVKTIRTMAHLGARAFGSISGEVVQTTACVAQNVSLDGYKPVFLRLLAGGEEEKRTALSSGDERFDQIAQLEFATVPGSPMAYWASRKVIEAFKKGKSLGTLSPAISGMSSCNSDRFLRRWHEVAWERIRTDRKSHDDEPQSNETWIPYNKGGGRRRWFGYNDNVIFWKNEGEAIKNFVTNNPKDPNTTHWSRRLFNLDQFYKPGITWSAVSSASFAVRIVGEGIIPGTGSKSMLSFAPEAPLEYLAGLLNSSPANHFLSFLSPTLNYEAGDVGKLPVLFANKKKVLGGVDEMDDISSQDWGLLETAITFCVCPLIGLVRESRDAAVGHATLESDYTAWITQNKETIAAMKRLEEENNRLFIDAYGLQDELIPDVPIEQITLTVNPAYRYGGKLSEEEQWSRFRQDTMQEFISYAVGCIFGRYALEKPGLILANQGATVDDYLEQIPKPSFPADDDNVIPILDGDWFSDDITGRFLQFLKVTFGEEHFEENLKFIEDALGKDIRKYFLKSFYTDHVKTYKKRPIYWLFSSPKGSFNALIYMHRYRPDTVSVVLNDYLREFRTKLSARKSHLEAVSISAGASQAEKTKALREIDKLNKVIEETEEYEREVLYPLATEQVEIDLDDGVKVNYNKFGTALKKIAGLSGK